MELKLLVSRGIREGVGRGSIFSMFVQPTDLHTLKAIHEFLSEAGETNSEALIIEAGCFLLDSKRHDGHLVMVWVWLQILV